MRLGGSVMKPYSGPKEWLAHVKELGYSCVIFPVDSRAPKQVQRDYAQCCRDNDLLIGEVGVWRNLMARDAAERAANIDYAIRQLEMAEEVGAASTSPAARANCGTATIPAWTRLPSMRT